jgi:hypothetical protein
VLCRASASRRLGFGPAAEVRHQNGRQRRYGWPWSSPRIVDSVRRVSGRQTSRPSHHVCSQWTAPSVGAAPKSCQPYEGYPHGSIRLRRSQLSNLRRSRRLVNGRLRRRETRASNGDRPMSCSAAGGFRRPTDPARSKRRIPWTADRAVVGHSFSVSERAAATRSLSRTARYAIRKTRHDGAPRSAHCPLVHIGLHSRDAGLTSRSGQACAPRALGCCHAGWWRRCALDA